MNRGPQKCGEAGPEARLACKMRACDGYQLAPVPEQEPPPPVGGLHVRVY